MCVHHWIIDSEDVGVCKLCHETKDFGALLNKDKIKRTEPIIVASDLLKIYGGTGKGSNIAYAREDMFISMWGIKL